MENQEYQINDFITLKLEGGHTLIYVEGEPFRQCKFLMLNIPIEEISLYDETSAIDSIDEAAEMLDRSLESRRNKKEFKFIIPPEEEFWGLCSNLEVWAENGYNTRILHSNLAFPLLRRLTEVGDPQAKKVFKLEITERYNRGSDNVRTFLEKRGYLTYLSKEEYYGLIDSPTEYETINELDKLLNSRRWKVDVRNGSVIQLSIRGHELTEIPKCIRNLKSLEWLDVGYNPLKMVPEWIGEFRSLKELLITENDITKLPSTIGNLQSLEILKLSNNQLKRLPDSIGNLSSLKTLVIFNNQLEELTSDIGKLTSLQELNLRDNKLTEIPRTIGTLINLEKLEIQKNHLQSLPESLGSLNNLKVLDVGKNELISIPKTIGNLKSLETLCLNENKLQEIPESIGDLKNLELLVISKNKISSLQMHYQNLIFLKKLHLDGNPFKGIPGFVYRLPNLQLINIMDTNIKKSGIMKKNFKKKIEIYK